MHNHHLNLKLADSDSKKRFKNIFYLRGIYIPNIIFYVT